jgi:two-component system LytT family response regulator
LIVDDEPLARQRIRRYLSQSGHEFVTEEAESGLKAVEAIDQFEPDVVFLDVEMPGLTGLEVLRQFNDRTFHVIFQTAFDEFAIKAFEENACDYLVKPFTERRFNQALDRALARVEDEARLRAIESRLAEREGYLSRVIVNQGGKFRIVECESIECFGSRDHYTCVYFDGAREGITKLSISALVEKLDPDIFIHLHRNAIARIRSIKSVASRRGEMTVGLANGMELEVSRSRRRTVREMIRKFNEGCN